ncbi:hypothetical protein [Mesorhizobium sp.]|uniref:hypothetical protein n=1 Tax=Mesorhizobium sp. TaxID=1871066 RepID=UPI000FE60AF3|nr:hypothetical protein [Mesorhizobium sp.]RWK59955.1 MAG: hypothetical protein EOR49_23690 [Mesorhizobium sp.]RWM47191.1 MAG: hypothetical protein EOR76_16700 [Mesorhizobium sp.]RWM51705.1 MAG: hypothetical protein EOR78_23540 [Mesorhizobium sp.]RWM55839.1 MAG: hypothetical protein EOR79_20690 [Mesorhizobium sp.]RWM98378.1 MAG: hypothetical protein EOR85_20345 [Mesorhizobium sp.]
MMKKILSATALSIALATSAMAQSDGTGSGTSDPGAATGTGTGTSTGTMAPGTDNATPADPNVTGSTTTDADGMGDRCKETAGVDADANAASGTATSDMENCPK